MENYSEPTPVKIYKLYPDVQTPEYATGLSACFDLRAYLPDNAEIMLNNSFQPYTPVVRDGGGKFIVLEPNGVALIPTGIIFDITPGYSVRLHSRSGSSFKESLVLGNGEGVIDADYVEETFIMIRNMSNETKRIYHGRRIAQAEVVKVTTHGRELPITEDRPQQVTERSGGFGSTGNS